MRGTDRVVIVSGGRSGIGRELGLAFVKEGARMVVADVNVSSAQETAGAIEAAGQPAVAVQTDVAVPARFEAMIAVTRAAFGRVERLFNGAGNISVKRLPDAILEEGTGSGTPTCVASFSCVWRQRSRSLSSRAAARSSASNPAWQARAGLSAVCMRLQGGHHCAHAGRRRGIGPAGVFVSAVAPGSIETGMTKSVPRTLEESQRTMAGIPLRRRAVPEGLTGSAIFLASDEFDYVTGAAPTVDGRFAASVD